MNIFEPIPLHKFASFSKEELIEFIDAQQKVNEGFHKRIRHLESIHQENKQISLNIAEDYITIKNKFFDRSSEKESSDKKQKPKKMKPRKKKVQLPSERYPNASLIVRDITLDNPPSCSCCGHNMKDTGMAETSEYLTVIPAKYIVIRQKRHTYGCPSCYGDMKTAPSLPRIKPSSSFSDDMIVDVSMSKYCDLIPVERYASIAARQGLEGLPPQSLIELTHYLSDFVYGAYEKLKEEILEAQFLHADETPHRMLEGDKNHRWYLWGFSTEQTSYFEMRDTRSGDVASLILKSSKCEYLVSDVFSGYSKAVKDTNEHREKEQLPLIQNIYCNAHARRKFKEAQVFIEEAQFFIDQYKKIYRLDRFSRGKSSAVVKRARGFMRPLFEKMKLRAMDRIVAYSNKSKIGKAMSYFLKNYDELVKFLDHSFLPIDNNLQERALRNPVIGRKTWYGNHSKRGAETAAVLFSLVESCKLNQINPRKYFKNLIEDLHKGKVPYTPKEFLNRASPDG